MVRQEYYTWINIPRISPNILPHLEESHPLRDIWNFLDVPHLPWHRRICAGKQHLPQYQPDLGDGEWFADYSADVMCDDLILIDCIPPGGYNNNGKAWVFGMDVR